MTLGLKFIFLMFKYKIFSIPKNPHADVIDFQLQ